MVLYSVDQKDQKRDDLKVRLRAWHLLAALMAKQAEKEGWWDGSLEGALEGISEGSKEGSTDGFREGILDLLGATDGIMLFVGSDDGFREGPEEGDPLGDTVKWLPPPHTQHTEYTFFPLK